MKEEFRILIIEDDKQLCETYAEYLRLEGYIVNTAYKYDDAINPFREFSLPLTSLLEWMDESSPGNITGLELDNGTEQNTIYYKYRYNDYGNPVLRFRSTTLGENEAIEKSL